MKKILTIVCMVVALQLLVVSAIYAAPPAQGGGEGADAEEGITPLDGVVRTTTTAPATAAAPATTVAPAAAATITTLGVNTLLGIGSFTATLSWWGGVNGRDD